MSWHDICGIISTVCFFIVFALSLYSISERNVYSIVSKLIAIAEETGLPGPEKMSMVVNGLYAIVPGVFKKILTKKKLEEIAQKIFDYMKEYALDYLARKAKEANRGKIKVNAEETESSKVGELVVGEDECGACSDCDSCEIEFDFIPEDASEDSEKPSEDVSEPDGDEE